MDEYYLKYTGENIAKQFCDSNKRKCFEYVWKQLQINYGDNVDFKRMSEHVLLCDNTKDFLYLKPQAVRYVKGKRPELESIVDKVCAGCETERETVFALMCYIRDLHKKFDGEQLFFGGTEEELIKKGEWLCECVARLMVALCEIKGIPGRTVFHAFSGHFTTELYFEEKWGYIDPRWGLFYLDDNCRIASVNTLIQNRNIILNQSEYVKSFHSVHQSYEYFEQRNYNMYFNPNESQCLCNYSLMDRGKYNFDWISTTKALRDIKEVHARYIELSKNILSK